jgi:diketogulonate reductase-like aldo/keto reductase
MLWRFFLLALLDIAVMVAHSAAVDDSSALTAPTCRIPTTTLSNGVEMPRLMLGTSHLVGVAPNQPSNQPSNQKPWSSSKQPVSFYGLQPDNTYRSLQLALEAGWRGIDSALIYRSHNAIQHVLGNWLASGRLERKDVFLTTKVFHGEVDKIGSLEATHIRGLDNMTPEKVTEILTQQVQDCFLQLGVGYLDLLLLHWPARMDSQDAGNRARRLAAWKVLEDFYQRGFVRAIGVSNFSEIHLEQLKQDGASIRPMVNQIEGSIYMQFDKIVDYCHQNNITIQAYSPLGNSGAMITQDPVVLEMAGRYHKDTGQIAMRYLLQKGYGSITCLSTSPQRLDTNQDIFSFELSEADMKKLDTLNRPDGSWGLPSPYVMT